MHVPSYLLDAVAHAPDPVRSNVTTVSFLTPNEITGYGLTD